MYNKMLLALATTLVMGATSLEAVPTNMSYQGRLTNAAGQVISQQVTMRFALYNSADVTGTNVKVWPLGDGYVTKTVVVTNGLYSVTLDGLNPELFNQDLWLEVQVADNTSSPEFETLSPRTQMTTTPYSYYAGTATKVIDDAITPAMINANVIGAGLQQNNSDKKIELNTAYSNKWTANQIFTNIQIENENNKPIINSGQGTSKEGYLKTRNPQGDGTLVTLGSTASGLKGAVSVGNATALGTNETEVNKWRASMAYIDMDPTNNSILQNKWMVGAGDLTKGQGTVLLFDDNTTTGSKRIAVINGESDKPTFYVDQEGDVVAKSVTIDGNPAATEEYVNTKITGTADMTDNTYSRWDATKSQFVNGSITEDLDEDKLNITNRHLIVSGTVNGGQNLPRIEAPYISTPNYRNSLGEPGVATGGIRMGENIDTQSGWLIINDDQQRVAYLGETATDGKYGMQISEKNADGINVNQRAGMGWNGQSWSAGVAGTNTMAGAMTSGGNDAKLVVMDAVGEKFSVDQTGAITAVSATFSGAVAIGTDDENSNATLKLNGVDVATKADVSALDGVANGEFGTAYDITNTEIAGKTGTVKVFKGGKTEDAKTPIITLDGATGDVTAHNVILKDDQGNTNFQIGTSNSNKGGWAKLYGDSDNALVTLGNTTEGTAQYGAVSVGDGTNIGAGMYFEPATDAWVSGVQNTTASAGAMTTANGAKLVVMNGTTEKFSADQDGAITAVSATINNLTVEGIGAAVSLPEGSISQSTIDGLDAALDAKQDMITDGTYLSFEVDGFVGNEVAGVTDATLVISGTGEPATPTSSASPKTIALNLGNTNTWTGVQTFSATGTGLTATTKIDAKGTIVNTDIGTGNSDLPVKIDDKAEVTGTLTVAGATTLNDDVTIASGKTLKIDTKEVATKEYVDTKATTAGSGNFGNSRVVGTGTEDAPQIVGNAGKVQVFKGDDDVAPAITLDGESGAVTTTGDVTAHNVILKDDQGNLNFQIGTSNSNQGGWAKLYGDAAVDATHLPKELVVLGNTTEGTAQYGSVSVGDGTNKGAGMYYDTDANAWLAGVQGSATTDAKLVVMNGTTEKFSADQDGAVKAVTATISGATTLSGELTVNSNVILGSDANNTIALKGTVFGNVVPSYDDAYNLGCSANRWKSIYVGPGSINIGTATHNATITYSGTSTYMTIDKDLKLGALNPAHSSEDADLALSGNLEVLGTIYGEFAGNVEGTTDKAKSLDGNVVGTIPYQGGSPVVTQYLAPDPGKLLVSGATKPEYKSVSDALAGQSVSGMVLTDGSIDGTAIGATTQSTGKFSTLTATNVAFANVLPKANIAKDLDIDGGTIKNTIIGASNPAAATFTDLTVSGTVTFATPLTDDQVANNLTINGGNITNSDISGATGSFTTLNVTGNTVLGTANGSNTITVNGVMTPSGTGRIEANSLKTPFVLSDSKTGILFEVINDAPSVGKAAHFKGSATDVAAVEIEHALVGNNALELVKGNLQISEGTALINNPSTNGKEALSVTQNSDYYGVIISSGADRLNSDNPLVAISNSSASSGSFAYALAVRNDVSNLSSTIFASHEGNGSALTAQSASGLAIEVPKGGVRIGNANLADGPITAYTLPTAKTDVNGKVLTANTDGTTSWETPATDATKANLSGATFTGLVTANDGLTVSGGTTSLGGALQLKYTEIADAEAIISSNIAVCNLTDGVAKNITMPTANGNAGTVLTIINSDDASTTGVEIAAKTSATFVSTGAEWVKINEVAIKSVGQVTAQPANKTELGTFSVVVSGTPSGYQWEYSTNGTTWNNVADATPAAADYSNENTPTLTVAGITATAIQYFRCKITFSGGVVYSNAATLDLPN